MIKLDPAATITEEFAAKVRSENQNAKIMKYAPIFVLLFLTAAFTLACGGAYAQAGDTLAKIKSKGEITLGVRDSSGALAYTIGDGKYVGFHTEMGERIAKDIQRDLKLPKLDVKFQPVTSQNRIPLMQNGTRPASRAACTAWRVSSRP